MKDRKRGERRKRESREGKSDRCEKEGRHSKKKECWRESVEGGERREFRVGEYRGREVRKREDIVGSRKKECLREGKDRRGRVKKGYSLRSGVLLTLLSCCYVSFRCFVSVVYRV